MACRTLSWARLSNTKMTVAIYDRIPETHLYGLCTRTCPNKYMRARALACFLSRADISSTPFSTCNPGSPHRDGMLRISSTRICICVCVSCSIVRRIPQLFRGTGIFVYSKGLVSETPTVLPAFMRHARPDGLPQSLCKIIRDAEPTMCSKSVATTLLPVFTTMCSNSMTSPLSNRPIQLMARI